jgi:hypothetical protein
MYYRKGSRSKKSTRRHQGRLSSKKVCRQWSTKELVSLDRLWAETGSGCGVNSPTQSMDSDTVAIIWRLLHLGPVLPISSRSDSRSGLVATLWPKPFSSLVEESMVGKAQLKCSKALKDIKSSRFKKFLI